MSTKLDELLELPFGTYMMGCWDHVREKAMGDPVTAVIYQYMIKEPAAIEAAWARRYWFHKNGQEI